MNKGNLPYRGYIIRHDDFYNCWNVTPVKILDSLPNDPVFSYTWQAIKAIDTWIAVNFDTWKYANELRFSKTDIVQ